MLSRRVLPQTSVILLMLTGPLSTLDIPLALFTFNLGVEAGQLMFVAAVLLSFKAVKAVYKVPPPTWRMVAAYGIGTISTVWLVSRVSSFS